MRNGSRNRKRTLPAFSLIEVLISSALFFVGLTAVFTTYNTAERIVAHNLYTTRALTLAEATLEELVERYPGDPLLEVGDHPVDPRRYDRNGNAEGLPTYTLTWNVSLYAKLAGVREITVRVVWFEGGRERELKLTTWRL